MTNWVEYSWVGTEKHFIDEIHTKQIGHVQLGLFGGNSVINKKAKNEDGCMIWVNEPLNVEFAVLLDAHKTAESAELVVATVQSLKKGVQQALALPPRKAFKNLENLLLTTFESQLFIRACQNVEGETACLVVVRKGKYLWWFSVGDCILHLHHQELVALGEYQQNHRSFYEWIGKVNTFDLEVPCYSIGTKELRKGQNHIFLTTDGLVECPNVNFDSPPEIFNAFHNASNLEGVHHLLNEIQTNGVLDSTTILSWFVNVEEEGMKPSDTI